MCVSMKTDLRDYSKSLGSEETSDPLNLLNKLSPMLNVSGGINAADDISKIISLMRNSKKLVCRCIYINILRVTSEKEVLNKFLEDGGWKVMNKWLSEAKDSENTSLSLEILKFLQQLPLNFQHLRENNTPKLVKHYAKSSDAKLKSIASQLINSWMALVVRERPSETGGAKKKKEKKKSKSEKNNSGEAKQKTSDKDKTNGVPVIKAPSFAKFRKTGLETDQPPKKKVKSKPIPVTKRSSVDNDGPVPEKKMKATDVKPKKITISEGFMDALNSASNPAIVAPKKIKRKPLKPSQSKTGTNPSSTKANQDALYSTGDASDFSASELLRKMSPKRVSPVPTDPAKPKLNKYGKPTKSVTWLCDEKLESIRYFEVDENERVNVSTQSFKDAQHREMMIERQMLKGKIPHAQEGNRDGSWRKPPPFEPLEMLVVPGYNSVEKDIQTEREKTVLMEIFLTKDMVPDSPAEPDPEPYEIISPKIIPFDDENAIHEIMEPDSGEHGNGNTTNNMPDGNWNMQNADGDLTEKLKEILQTATAISNSNGNNGAQLQGELQQPMDMPGPPMHNDPNQMMGMPPGDPQMMQNMNMNGPNGGPVPMGFYGGQMQMMPMQDPNFYGHPNWRPPHNGPMMPNGPPMGPPPHMNGPNFNPGNWNRPKWVPRGGPPRPEFRNQWRARWDSRRRR